MHVITVAGMLGSGKTSVILKLIDPMIATGTKVAVIENDFGELGVDSEVLERNGMPVRDLKGGCICCTLQSGLVDSLRMLESTYDPEYVIVEPTGVADPEMVIKAVTDVDGIHIDAKTTLIVVDCERFQKFKKMFERPLKNQLRTATVALLNKVDTVTPEDIEEIKEGLRSFGYDGPCLEIRADNGQGMDAVVEVIRR